MAWTIKGAAEQAGLKPITVYSRLRNGWTLSDALEQTVRKRWVRDLLGKRFGRLLVIRFDSLRQRGNGMSNKAYWLCRCDCGKEVAVGSDCLVRGQTRSCGCLRREKSSRMLTYKGETLSIRDWAKRLGMHRGTLSLRLHRGLSIEEALTRPLGKRSK